MPVSCNITVNVVQWLMIVLAQQNNKKNLLVISLFSFLKLYQPFVDTVVSSCNQTSQVLYYDQDCNVIASKTLKRTINPIYLMTRLWCYLLFVEI